MFTGIVEEVGSVLASSGTALTIAASRTLQGIQPGGSIAINGTCLTVTQFDNRSFTVEVMPETLKKTNLGRLRPGDRVNLERPVALGGELGGHLVQGHVDGTGIVSLISREGEARLMRFRADAGIMRYIVPKGFVAVDGISLTVASRDAISFTVSIVGYTLHNTTLIDRKPGDSVNIEVDIIGKYVAGLMGKPETGLTAALLREHGFPVSDGE